MDEPYFLVASREQLNEYCCPSVRSKPDVMSVRPSKALMSRRSENVYNSLTAGPIFTKFCVRHRASLEHIIIKTRCALICFKRASAKF